MEGGGHLLNYVFVKMMQKSTFRGETGKGHLEKRKNKLQRKKQLQRRVRNSYLLKNYPLPSFTLELLYSPVTLWREPTWK